MPTSSSTPGKLDLQHYQGDVFRRHITVTADATPYDFTGHTARMQVRAHRGASVVDLELTDADGGITFGAGTIDLFVDAADMADLSGAKQYDLELTPSDSETFTLLTGKFTISKDVSE